MARKRHTAEEIVAKLRQVDVLTAQGRPVAEAVRAIGVSEVAPRRAARRRGVLLAGGSQDRDRGLAATLQRQPPALGPGLPTARSRGGPMAGAAGHPGRGPKAAHALTFDPDHPMGAGQSPRSVSASPRRVLRAGVVTVRDRGARISGVDALAPIPHSGSRDTDGLRAAELQHPVQGMDGNGDLGGLMTVRARAERVSNHPLVAGDRYLGQSATIVS